MKVVEAWVSGSSWVNTNTHLICAERRLVMGMLRDAHRHGVPRHRLRAWLASRVRRVHVDRFLASGARGCSLPCQDCRRALDALDARVICGDKEGSLACLRCTTAQASVKRCQNRPFRLW